MFVKPHTHDSTSHLALNEAEEYPLDKTLPENFLDSLSRNSTRNFISFRSGLSTCPADLTDKYQSITYAQSAIYINKITNQLLELGVTSQDRISIYAKNSPLWLLTDIAISFAGGISVPIFDTLGAENIAFCWNLTGVKFIATSAEYLPTVVGIASSVPSLVGIIVFDDIIIDEKMVNAASKIYSFVVENGPQIIDDNKSMYSVQSTVVDGVEENEINHDHIAPIVMKILKGQSGIQIVKIALPEDISLEAAEVAMKEMKLPENQVFTDPNSVIFTSGTSGKPKGAVLSHKNVCAGGACLGRQFVPYSVADSGEQSTMLSYLPLAHVFERCMEHLCSFRGYNIYYSSGNMKNIAKDFELAQVTVFMGVPRVYQKIYDNVMKQLSQQNFIVQTVFNTCYFIKKHWLQSNMKNYRSGKLDFIDKIAFAKIAKSLGGKVEYVISGSSALPADVEEFLRVCSCARLTLGFGLTELSTTGLFNYCGQKMNDPSQLGFSAYLTEAKIVECKECEFDFQKEKIGELCIKGPGVCMGYVDEHWGKLTNITDSDGFYHTGDLCRLNADGTASFIRRISLVVKLQHGEFVDLAALEQILESSSCITNSFVHAEASRAAPVAIVCVDSKVCMEKFGTKNPEMLADLIEKEGDRIIRNAGMKGFNVPRAYKVLVDVDWSNDRRFITPTQKKQHINLRKCFAEELQELFKKCDKGSKHMEGFKMGEFKGKLGFAIIGVAILSVAVFACLK